jgi:hypothetical protein
MQMKMTVTYSDGTKKECTSIFADFVAFERTWSRSVAKFESELRLTDIAWLAWKTEIRNRYTTETFDDWLLKVDTIDIVTDDVDQPEESKASDPLD